ncbi:hypothetical protein AYI68_g6770 [Smittium mucronatum]|uniref:Uncharacterized protein n=1 Tax=Smittium mucronatum TaxID=133383 RepID=A0A1R0GQJ4_9FUNG|nr:hypothetical protein AYI68_g6770 [Smittium mucronatum]
MGPPSNKNIDADIKKTIRKRIAIFQHLHDSLIPHNLPSKDPSNRVPFRQPFMGLIILDPEQVNALFNDPKFKPQIRLLFILGTSISLILDLEDSQEFLKATEQLTSELDAYLDYISGKATKPFEFDFAMVFESFCHVAVLVYLKLENMHSSLLFSHHNSDIFFKLDAHFRNIIQSTLSDLDNVFRTRIASAFMEIDTATKPENSDQNLDLNIKFIS